MDHQQSNKQLSGQERWLARRQEKLKTQQSGVRNKGFNRTLKIFLWVLVIAGSIGGLIAYEATRPPTPEGDIISRNGIHWHPKLTINIKGQDQEIQPDIGLGGAEMTIHTHDTSGTIHQEIPGLVTKEDIKLGRFFKIWGKQFTSTCIFDKCNGPEGKVSMTVNGKANTDFENYLMHDKDTIEIHYE